ncbi:MAG: Gfo/Idh/MocA family protein [Planctomycetota bacterium]|jgi:predicted dehydrogenase
MSTLHASSRREFLKTAAAGTAAAAMTAASYARTPGANGRIRIGQIGCGNRGFGAHMAGVHKHAEQENVEIAAVCDVWTEHLKRAAAKVKEWFGRAPLATTKYEDVLAMKDLDAVMIASPDHQHCMHLEAAAQAGKDAYCEKPLAMNMEELKSACDAVKAAGIVVQIGTQSRSYPGMAGAKARYETGALGSISRIEQMRNGTRPYWYKRLTRLPITESEVDWREFLKPLPDRPFSARLFAGWYGYRDFSSGTIGGYMSHFVDLVHYVTGAKFPRSAVAQGGTFIWKDENNFTCPDHVQTTLIYPEGFMVSYVTNFGNGAGSRTAMYGTHGVLDFTNRQGPTVSGAGAIEKGSLGKGQPVLLGRGNDDKEVPVEPVERPDHFLNWLQCLRSRKSPVAPIEAGYQHAVACILSDRAWETGRRQVYDHQKREIREG